MKLFKKLFSMAVAVLPLAASAQNSVDIKFETQDYKSVGVYDWWEASPFRTGELKGNCRVVANPFADEPGATNVSARVLALQRSRFGSNMFGARIDLNEDQRFELDNQFKYVHVLIRKPVSGRSMIIGLGRHNENTPGYEQVWADQKEDVEQFTVLGNNKASADKWTDVVFPIKGAGNITIYSLVVVVDCEAPTNLTEDFACYIDNIKVNGSKKPENAVVGDYPACFDNEQEYTRSDRKLNSVTVTTQAGAFTKAATGKTCRTEVFDGYIPATPGEQVTVQCDYKGSWMHSFFYLDKNQDGKFSATDELVTYRNSNQNDFSAKQAFTIPEGLAPGIYRLRAKVDWESTDPAGNPGDEQGKNYIIDNGGGMIDVLFNIYNPEETMVNVGSNQRNGTVLLADGNEMSDYKHQRLTDLTVLPKGAEGFFCSGLIIRHGYNVGIVSDSLQHSNPQYLAYEVDASQFAEDGTYTIPGLLIDSDVIVEGIMTSGDNPDQPDQPDEPDPSAVDKFFTAEQLRAAVAQNGKASIGILNVTTTGNKYINGGSCTEVASADGTLEGVRAPFDEEIVEVIATEGGYLLHLADVDAEDGYFDCQAGGNLSLVEADQALVWQILGKDDEGYGEITQFDDLYSDINKEVNEYMVRFVAHDQYLNAQGTNAASGLRGGKGAWSFNYVYNTKCDEAGVGVNTVLAPEYTNSIYNLAGQRVAFPVKGINIVGGRKVIR